jgi:hypothetical protein
MSTSRWAPEGGVAGRLVAGPRPVSFGRAAEARAARRRIRPARGSVTALPANPSGSLASRRKPAVSSRCIQARRPPVESLGRVFRPVHRTVVHGLSRSFRHGAAGRPSATVPGPAQGWGRPCNTCSNRAFRRMRAPLQLAGRFRGSTASQVIDRYHHSVDRLEQRIPGTTGVKFDLFPYYLLLFTCAAAASAQVSKYLNLQTFFKGLIKPIYLYSGFFIWPVRYEYSVQPPFRSIRARFWPPRDVDRAPVRRHGSPCSPVAPMFPATPLYLYLLFPPASTRSSVRWREFCKIISLKIIGYSAL